MQHDFYVLKKGIILLSSAKNYIILGIISVKKNKNRFYVGRQERHPRNI